MLLGVNIDHIATIRNARGGENPNVLECARLCINNGADSITTHLREDRRHIKDNDVRLIRAELDTKLNLEMAMTEEMQKIALEVKPDAVCLVPEKRQEVTTEGGLDIAGQLEYGIKFIKPLVDSGIEVSLFIDPDINQVSAAYKTGAQFIELHTGTYSNMYGKDGENDAFNDLKNAAAFAQTLGLKVNAGHGLDYMNVIRMHEIDGLYELNIGHSIISRAISVGLPAAVKEMKELVEND